MEKLDTHRTSPKSGRPQAVQPHQSQSAKVSSEKHVVPLVAPASQPVTPAQKKPIVNINSLSESTTIDSVSELRTQEEATETDSITFYPLHRVPIEFGVTKKYYRAFSNKMAPLVEKYDFLYNNQIMATSEFASSAVEQF